ncbi:peptidase M23 family [Thermodesulfobium acidiphilum]|uniref:Peptidase M23 family n=1 Tax=Thermodesulfobium acidiphilum TaxID=1794699 RepID=A0A2R4VYQ7_THEAF|nr:peptidoglycan DD-metalloendopeptidase family protein [Thermodesulfobium acidiphilum]AWB09580.1 peptidase M23 family [Thermodesulfobium acidiphilum]
MNRYIISLLLSLFLLTVILPYAIGKSRDGVSTGDIELERLKGEVDQIEENLNRLKLYETKGADQLSIINANLTLKEAEIKYVNYKINLIEKNISDTTSQIEHQKDIIQQKEQEVGKRLRSIYMMQELPFLDVILSMNNNINDWFESVILFQRIESQDRDVLDQYSLAEAKLRDLLQSQNNEKSKLFDLKQKLFQKEKRIIEQRNEKMALLLKDTNSEVSYNQHTQDLSSRSRESSRGFIWPVVGPITSGYGWRIHPIFKIPEFHTGIDIGVPYGTPILAAKSGVVTYSGWGTGYGNLVILNNGSGIETRYSHASRLAVYVGERVRQGQVIAYVGSTGWSTGPHLFFEIRINGKPVNPLNYLP